MLDEHLFWNDYVRTIENKIAKNTGLYFLNEDSLKTVFFSYIYSYLNYANKPFKLILTLFWKTSKH